MGSVHFFDVIAGDGADTCRFVSSKKGVVNDFFLVKTSLLCFNYTYVRRKVKMQNHSLNTTLSVCKRAVCYGYI